MFYSWLGSLGLARITKSNVLISLSLITWKTERTWGDLETWSCVTKHVPVVKFAKVFAFEFYTLYIWIEMTKIWLTLWKTPRLLKWVNIESLGGKKARVTTSPSNRYDIKKMFGKISLMSNYFLLCFSINFSLKKTTRQFSPLLFSSNPVISIITWSFTIYFSGF